MAGGVVGGGITSKSITAGVAATAVTGNGGRRYLLIQNLHATATIYVRVDQSADNTATVAVVGAAGTIKLGPSDSVVWEGDFVPLGALSVISDTAATPVTILEGT